MAHLHLPMGRPSTWPPQAPPVRGNRSRLVYRVGLSFAVLLLLAIVLYLVLGAYIALKLTAPDPMPARASPAAYSLVFESLQIHTQDGIALASWFIPRADSDRAVVMVHGLWTCRSCELDGRQVELANHLHAAGYNVLMIDMRKHGQSQGEHITFGQEERRDVLAAVDWLDQRGFDKIGVIGISLGGASSVYAAADLQDGGRIRALVLDSVFAEWVPTLEQSFTLETGLPNQLLPGAILMVRVLLGVDFYAIKPVEKLPSIKAPVMLIYGGKDKYVSEAQMTAMEKARPDATVWYVPDAGHTRIYNVHEQEYVARVTQFFGNALR